MGWIFSVSVQQERDFPLSEKEVRAMAAHQAEAPDDFFVTVSAPPRSLPRCVPLCQSSVFRVPDSPWALAAIGRPPSHWRICEVAVNRSV